MSQNSTYQAEFAPPPEPARGRSFAFAAAAHVLLFVGLGLVTRWSTQPTVVSAEAELWSAVPQQAAPRLVEPEPAPPPPEPEPVKPRPAPPPKPDPAVEQRDAAIALKKQKEKEDEKKKALEKEKAEKLRKDKAEKEKAEKEKAEKEKKAKEDKEREKKKAEAEKRQKDEAQNKAEAALADALRKEQLKRTMGQAGASGNENSNGTALKSAGPSVSYASKLKAKIGHIFYSGTDNPVIEVRVRATSTGRVISITPVLPSTSAAWNESVMSALSQRLDVLPTDVDGRIHTDLVIPVSPAMINR